MNLRRKTPNDSLYLLLDTLCNAFGGIILLAVLVVLLTSKTKMESAAGSDSQELLQRRLTLAQTNLQKSLQRAAVLRAEADDSNRQAQFSLLAARKELQDHLRESREAAELDARRLETASAADPAERVKLLNAAFAKAQAETLEKSNSLSAENDNIRRLKQRKSDMERQIAARVKDLQRPLRLPKEHDTNKKVVYVILRFGNVYPCRNADFSRNETDITWFTFFSMETAQPIKGKGIDPVQNAAGLSGYFQGLASDSVYVVFCVFDDSFPAFLRAKESAVASGIAYGWEPFSQADSPVTFGAAGYTPKAQ